MWALCRTNGFSHNQTVPGYCLYRKKNHFSLIIIKKLWIDLVRRLIQSFLNDSIEE